MLVAAIGKALLAGIVYAIPAASIAFFVRGLADPSRETWDIPDEAMPWKRGYHLAAKRVSLLLRLLTATFLVHTTAFVALRGEDACAATQTSHLSAAAYNITQVTDLAFLVGFSAWGLMALAGAVFAVMYNVRSKQNGWADPRKRDLLIIHLILIPLASLLLWVGFASVVAIVCGS